ncbi:MAG: OsmC family protein [Fimbriimonadales bacterium]|jgi:peroxiredoxin-like protein|nr:OsmC family protein [Armatimonadota bacterium]MCX7686675.1 OsmC family protein [Fimbriimonadales bacterium]GBC90107.1 hypothetical protein HRbin14_00839 [bacterium HR14]CUU38106.1 peroxiredoxin, SACOL1771 subfamily [Armatimonadetes bacterium DC]
MHTFSVSAEWTGDSNSVGSLQSPGGLHCHFAVPTDFGGPGGCPSPEEMLLAALASCYVITIAYMAELKKLPLQKQTIQVQGVVERDPQTRRLRFTRFEINLHFTVAPDATDAQIESILKLAKDAKTFCLVSNSLSEQIQFEVHTDWSRA